MTPERRIDMMGTKAWSDFGGNRGVGAPKIRFSLVGEKGAVSFSVSTGWYLPETYDAWAEHGRATVERYENRGVAVVLHFPMQDEDGYPESGPDECDILDGVCWGDMSYLAAEPLYETLIREGEEAFWSRLTEDWYVPRIENR